MRMKKQSMNLTDSENWTCIWWHDLAWMARHQKGSGKHNKLQLLNKPHLNMSEGVPKLTNSKQTTQAGIVFWPATCPKLRFIPCQSITSSLEDLTVSPIESLKTVFRIMMMIYLTWFTHLTDIWHQRTGWAGQLLFTGTLLLRRLGNWLDHRSFDTTWLVTWWSKFNGDLHRSFCSSFFHHKLVCTVVSLVVTWTPEEEIPQGHVATWRGFHFGEKDTGIDKDNLTISSDDSMETINSWCWRVQDK